MSVTSSCAECGGLAAAELKKKEEETEGNEDPEPERGLSGRDTAGLAEHDDMERR